MADLQGQIEEMWERRIEVEPGDKYAPLLWCVRPSTFSTPARRASRRSMAGRVVVHEWLKQAILLLFRLSKMETIELGPFEYADKMPLKSGFKAAGVRVVPGASARFGSFLDRGVVLMPSYVNIGARVGAQHDGRHVGDGRLVRPDRRQRAPLGRRRHRRRARAAAGRAGDRRGRLPHRQPVHRRRRRPRRAGAACSAPGCILTGSIPVIDAQTGAEVRSRERAFATSSRCSATRPRTFRRR